METQVNYTIIGAFVISFIASIVIAIIWLSSGFAIAHYTTYQVFMKESVSGLNLDAAVEYNGVNVGFVSEIGLDQQDPTLIRLLLKIKNKTPITQGTTARLNVRALSGLAFILLEDKGTNRAPLHHVRGQPYLTINSAPSFLLRLDTALNQLNDNFHEISTAIKSLLDQENILAIKQILSNTKTMTQQLLPMLQSTQGSLQILQTQTLPTATQAIDNLNELTHNLSIVSAEIKQNPAILVRGKEFTSLGPGE